MGVLTTSGSERPAELSETPRRQDIALTQSFMYHRQAHTALGGQRYLNINREVGNAQTLHLVGNACLSIPAEC